MARRANPPRVASSFRLNGFPDQDTFIRTVEHSWSVKVFFPSPIASGSLRETFIFNPVRAITPNRGRCCGQPQNATGRRGLAHSLKGLVRLSHIRLLQFRQDFIQVETGRLLPLRIIFKRQQKLSDVILRRDKKEGIVKKPIVIGVRRDIGTLV